MWDQQKNINHRAGRGKKTVWVCVFITFWTVHAFVTQRSYSYWGHFCVCVCLSCVLFECGWAVRSPLSAQFCNRRHIPAAALCTRRICCSHENPKDVQICKLAVCHICVRYEIFFKVYILLFAWLNIDPLMHFRRLWKGSWMILRSWLRTWVSQRLGLLSFSTNYINKHVIQTEQPKQLTLLMRHT